jgi:hypothetical protein
MQNRLPNQTAQFKLSQKESKEFYLFVAGALIFRVVDTGGACLQTERIQERKIPESGCSFSRQVWRSVTNWALLTAAALAQWQCGTQQPGDHRHC